MRLLRLVLPALAALGCAALVGAAPADDGYTPQAQFCYPQAIPAPGGSPLCAIIPGNITPDQMLQGNNAGYKGILDSVPRSPEKDVETPFDNYSWQTFIGLNWLSLTETNSNPVAARAGLSGLGGLRTWETYHRVSDVFGQSPVQANCGPVPKGYVLFSMGSNGKGQPVAQNEEYIQAATLEPAIDVTGNFTLYERRVNDVEIAYLKNPGGKQHPLWNLTTYIGQRALATTPGGKVNFPSFGPPTNGAMEIKAAWRILDPAQHAANVKKYYVQQAVVAVAADLVDRGPQAIILPICIKVDLGLVAMHIIQKNPVTNNHLLPEWFWTTFEHVDNAPYTSNPCDVVHPAACTMLNQTACPLTTSPGSGYSYFDPRLMAAQTNYPPSPGPSGAFHWNGQQPYAKAYLQTVPGSKIMVGSQITRCWKIYALTAEINKQWQAQLRAIGSPFANYMLIGTQWGTKIESSSENIGPLDAAPGYLSNSVVETYLQTFYKPNNTYSPFTTGSCIDCHTAATLTATNSGQPVSSDFSFLPGLVQPALIRMLPPRKGFTEPKK